MSSDVATRLAPEPNAVASASEKEKLPSTTSSMLCAEEYCPSRFRLLLVFPVLFLLRPIPFEASTATAGGPPPLAPPFPSPSPRLYPDSRHPFLWRCAAASPPSPA